MAYRRKVFINVAAGWDTTASSATTTYWRAYMRTGYGVTQLRFDLALSLSVHPNDPYVEIVVTESGGASQTIRVDYGSAGTGADDAPYQFGQILRQGVDVDPDTAYEIAVIAYGGARPLTVTGYEYANPEIDGAVAYYAEIGLGSVEQPITHSLRKTILDGLSAVWMGNGAHLLTWAGDGGGTANSVTGTTWTNIIDESSTSVSASTPGYYFAANVAGSLADLLPLVRIKDGNDLPVTLAVYGNASAASGEVRLVDSGAAGPSITTIGTTLQWYTTNTTWSNVDAIAGSGKVDLQARHSTAGQTVNVYAVSVLARNA